MGGRGRVNATEVLNEARRAGIVLFVEGDRLRYRAPRGALTPALRATVEANRAALLALLQQREPVSEGTKGYEGAIGADETVTPSPDDGFGTFSSFAHQGGQPSNRGTGTQD